MEFSEIIIFKALADSTRVEILFSIGSKGKNVTEICSLFRQFSQPTISHHLQILKHCHLVETKKQGKMVFYYINKEKLEIVIEEFLRKLAE
jgi:DNA-binding transcriptional ArsR family regulator